MRPSIRQLEYAVALADCRNFRRAAESCHVTQPALSNQIQQLEENLGVRLFERDPKGVLLTAAGERVVQAARGVLLGIDELMARADHYSDPLAGELRLGVIPTIAPYFLPRAIRAIRDRYPSLRLFLREDQTAVLVDKLVRGELDLLLLAIDVDVGELAKLPLFEDRFVVAMSPEHPLTRHDQIEESDLRGEPVLLLEDGHCLRDQTLLLCDAAGACEYTDFRASSLGTLVQMVSEGIGITLLPELALDVEGRAGGRMTVRSFVAPVPFRTIGLAWRRASPHAARYEELGGALRQVAEGG